jgi:hypothetical protein
LFGAFRKSQIFRSTADFRSAVRKTDDPTKTAVAAGNGWSFFSLADAWRD